MTWQEKLGWVAIGLVFAAIVLVPTAILILLYVGWRA